MSDLVPLIDEPEHGTVDGGKVGEAGGAEVIASEDAEPLLNGVQSRTLERREGEHEARADG
jgi:hypothetical protein